MKRLKEIFTAATVIVALTATLLPVAEVGAINVFQGCSGTGSTVCASKGDNLSTTAQAVISTMLMVLGIMAVIVIIIGGIMYTTSTGDASRIKTAKDTVLYAVIGLVVAILAYAIVNFVVGKF